MAEGARRGKGNSIYASNTGGRGRRSTGIAGKHYGKPQPINLLKPGGENGPVKIIKKAKTDEVQSKE